MTLLELLAKQEVVIPRIQRDYAQGRESEKIDSIRNKFLSDLKEALLHDDKSLDLNFIYGKTVNDSFLPVDGQQRLTTVWLLHLYLYSRAGNSEALEKLKKFSYETRETSKAFLKELVEHHADMHHEAPPSEAIVDSHWFSHDWAFDPSVQSVLVMLDAIHKHFAESDLQTLIAGLESGKVYFFYLPIAEIGSPDDLYIKLNARGKMLSSFENVKAILVGQAQEHLDKDDFTKNMDGIWTDYFWSRSKEKFDEDFARFLEVLFHNYGVIDTYGNKDWWYTLSNETTLAKIDAPFLTTLYHTLNFLCKVDKDEKLNAKIDPFILPKEEINIERRYMFFVLSEYARQAKDKAVDLWADGLAHQWFRVMNNLVYNSYTTVFREDDERVKTFSNVLAEIKNLSEHWDGILAYISDSKHKIGALNQEQVKEERIKASIILHHPEKEAFATAIYAAEKHRYFGGQIRAALYLAGDKDKPEALALATFNKYWATLSQLFKDSVEQEAQAMHVLRSALLTFGNDCYYRPSEYIQYMFYSTNPRETNSLRALFADEAKRKYTLPLLDVLQKKSLADIIENHLVDPATKRNDWQYCLVKYPQLFRHLHPTHMYADFYTHVNRFLLLSKKTGGGYCHSVFLAALEDELNTSAIKQNLHVEYWFKSGAKDYHNLVFPKENGWDRKGWVVYDYIEKQFIILHHNKKGDEEELWRSTSDDPISETVAYIEENIKLFRK
nr:DUF262 domain-containing protein [Entomospira culicis]